jgi:folylpolyglutamate synthase/dihydropteroate synthase
VILDVAHNVEAARNLADNLAASGFAPETIAVCGMLRDKDITGVLRALAPRITRWHFASLARPARRVCRGSRRASASRHADGKARLGEKCAGGGAGARGRG